MKLLFFAPFSGIWEHSALETRLAAALQQAGHDVTYVTCGGILHRHCIVMAAMHLAPDAGKVQRDRICGKCTARADAARAAFGLKGPKLSELLDQAELDAIEARVALPDGQALLDTVWHGVPVGRRALFPFLVYKKKDDLEFSSEMWREYRDQLHQTMVAVSGAKRLLEIHKPDTAITYSATYSVVSSFLEVVRSVGARDYFVEASGNLAHRDRRAILGRTGIIEWFATLRRMWPQFEDQPVDPVLLTETGDHLVTLFGATSPFSYSPSASKGSDATTRAAVQAPDGARILVATMSSYDEWFAAEVAGLAHAHAMAFPSQLEWLDWLIEFARSRPDLHLVIRVHPREFPNRRERSGRLSSHALKLQKRLASLPANCFVNWPSQNLSLYDLAKQADVVLNAWSSAGREVSLLGLPVVEWVPGMLIYAPNPAYCATDRDGYRACIERALEDGWQEGNIVRMLRWCALEYGVASFVTRPDSRPGPAPVSFALRVARKLARARLDAWLARRSPISPDVVRAVETTLQQGQPLLANQPGTEREAEVRAMATEIRRVVIALFGDAEPTENRLKLDLLGFAASLTQQASPIPAPGNRSPAS